MHIRKDKNIFPTCNADKKRATQNTSTPSPLLSSLASVVVRRPEYSSSSICGASVGGALTGTLPSSFV